MAFKRVKLRELLHKEKTLLKQLDNVTEWTPEMACRNNPAACGGSERREKRY